MVFLAVVLVGARDQNGGAGTTVPARASGMCDVRRGPAPVDRDRRSPYRNPHTTMSTAATTNASARMAAARASHGPRPARPMSPGTM
jgi:hypothetical protein